MIMRFFLPLSLGHVARMLAVGAWLLAGGHAWADDDGFVFILNKDHTDGWRQLGEGEVKLHEGGGITLIPGKRGKSRSEEHTSELQSRPHLVCRLLLEKK